MSGIRGLPLTVQARDWEVPQNKRNSNILKAKAPFRRERQGQPGFVHLFPVRESLQSEVVNLKRRADIQEALELRGHSLRLGINGSYPRFGRLKPPLLFRDG